uniref:Uncharacterized protein n=1 Tax=Aegilops tauschii subsp. strangulata TaxID=200361 RepID=A0A453GEF3_AEGTS
AADSVGLRAHLPGVRGFLHAPPLPPHPGLFWPTYCQCARCLVRCS